MASGETMQPKYLTVMSFNRALAVPVVDHAFIKAAMAVTAQEIFPEPTVEQATELRSLPFDASSVEFATLDKVGGDWSRMDVVMPDKLPAGVFDQLPEGTHLRLRGRNCGDDLLITRSFTDDLPFYTVQAQTSRYSQNKGKKPYPALTERDVTSLILSGLGIHAFGREISGPDDAKDVMRDLAFAHPTCERVCMDGRRETWEIDSPGPAYAAGSMSSSAALIRLHHDSFNWKRPRETYKFIGTTTLPLSLPLPDGTYGNPRDRSDKRKIHHCTANRKVTYSFNKLYSRNENDIQADLEVEFTSENPVADTTRRQYAHLFNESGPRKQDTLAQDIVQALAHLSMAYRDNLGQS